MTKDRSVMKLFEGKTFYETLNLPPSAGLTEIEQAYAEAIEMYNEDSLSTYALFSDEERNNILEIIEKAFQTLSSKEKKADYDQMLISTGRVEAAVFSEKPDESSREPQESHLPPEPPEHAEPAEKKLNEDKFREILNTITERGLVSGEDLKQLREARGVDLSEIFQTTRISKTTLGRIEQNQYDDLPAEVFLKSFLKSYAEILQIDPDFIVDGYLKYKGKGHILNLQPGKS
jgi:curved DNA-binding protein CbpA